VQDADSTIVVRPIAAADAESVRALLDVALGSTPHLAHGLDVVDRALGGGDPEHRALVALRNRQILGVACFGDLLGSENVVELHLVALASPLERATASTLLRAVDDAARASGARFVFAELPDDGTLDTTFASLRNAGYREETRIADYVRDGVALVFLRRTL
jgi:hypothetical protein